MPWDRTIIYETHVRGFTKLHPAVPEELRGTFSGLGRKEVIDYIRSLGVTSVELLPIHAFVNDRHLLEKGLTNYWGYNTIGFFAPDPRYSAVPAFVFAEFKEMVARLHDAGLEVILDVVYNHTAEGNERGPTLSFRGIDNASYYRLLPEQPRYYINDTGTGNTLNLSHPRVLQMVTDSLRYWVTEMHVDGFRFDLGTILAREHDGFDDGARLPAELPAGSGAVVGEADRRAVGHRPGRLSGRRLPARLGGVERQVPRHGARVLEGRRRQAARDSRRGSRPRPMRSPAAAASHGPASTSSPRMTASRCTTSSRTTTSTTRRTARTTRTAIPTICRGTTAPRGRPTMPEIIALRNRQKRNLLATLLLAQGTPMLLAGDEFGRTQQGNNNAYAQDNEISWVDWNITEDGAALIEFVRRVIALRQAFPILRRSRFLTGEYNAELDVKDVRWLTPSATDIEAEQWQDTNARCFGMLLDGRAQATGIKRPSMDATVLLVLNAYHDVVKFKLPEVVGGQTWRCLLDTNAPDRTETPRFQSGDEYEVTGRSLLLFALQPDSVHSVALTRAREALRQVAETPVQSVLAEEPAQ